jgi:hypothetical protein
VGQIILFFFGGGGGGGGGGLVSLHQFSVLGSSSVGTINS